MYDGEYSRNGKKIPVDDEPISRSSSREQNSSSRKRGMSFVDVLQFLICLILIISVVIMYSRISNIQNERAIYNMDITSESSNIALAGAKGMLSTVNVGARLSNSSASMRTSSDFFNNNYSLGSGVIYSIDKSQGTAYIITNYHVVANASSSLYKNGYGVYTILPWDSDVPIQATLIGGSHTYDIAVLKVTNSEVIKNSSCVQAEIASSTEIVLCEPCVAIGNSMGKNLRVTSGVISVEEMVFSKAYETYVTYLSHNADINSGNSGGGLYNEVGKLIGIVNAKFADVDDSGTLYYGEVVHGMFYAIPSSIAVAVAQNIIRNDGSLLMPNIGLVYGKNYTWESKSMGVDENGLRTQYSLVLTTSSNGLLAGDKLLSVSYSFAGANISTQLDHISSIESHIFNWKVGTEVTFKVLRAGIEKTVKITVEDTTALT